MIGSTISAFKPTYQSKPIPNQKHSGVCFFFHVKCLYQKSNQTAKQHAHPRKSFSSRRSQGQPFSAGKSENEPPIIPRISSQGRRLSSIEKSESRPSIYPARIYVSSTPIPQSLFLPQKHRH
ncbi:hypothetical protein CEXT_596721 [Caerostris extrusa]|uniref:Uncharacterized protein n=1 Tax=Caerostris extrusa TaxID=172846 RepID=A0AAV4R2H1_CAEEX|nr:hypothetical protein CEXT_596721 [Caerostris extrusa]